MKVTGVWVRIRPDAVYARNFYIQCQEIERQSCEGKREGKPRARVSQIIYSQVFSETAHEKREMEKGCDWNSKAMIRNCLICLQEKWAVRQRQRTTLFSTINVGGFDLVSQPLF